MLRESSKINSVDLKKKVDKIFEIFFENPPPPRENPRSAPDYKPLQMLKSDHKNSYIAILFDNLKEIYFYLSIIH